MATANIRQKLYDYIRVADMRKVKAIYTMLEDEIEVAYDYWNDKDFVADLDRRSEDYKTGRVQGVSWEDTKMKILASKTGKRK
ncbi:addiction module protein [Parasegetibacter sp. NRK P23]|uniref:addiction module protein n=1 Tax=Parasegetibacter sp. NRK P23 TaxID=2942999 RepID=UPI002043A1BD|nr:addiction module protein [Parasegetibacter sp. NRK P23]MCM5526825.1 addiction module protein [Parasegetibacter sp. NRK P23]